MENVAILLKHVDLLNTSDGLNTELLESGLELSVITLRGGDRLLDDLSSGSTLAAYHLTHVVFRAGVKIDRVRERERK